MLLSSSAWAKILKDVPRGRGAWEKIARTEDADARAAKNFPWPSVTYPLPCLLPNQSSFSSAPGHSIRRSPSWSAPRYWTKGGTLRSFPVGGGTRKKPSSSSELPRRLLRRPPRRRGRTPRAPAAARVRPLRLTLRRLPTADILLRRDARAPGHGSEERGLLLRATPPRSSGGARHLPRPARPLTSILRWATGAGNAGPFTRHRRCASDGGGSKHGVCSDLQFNHVRACSCTCLLVVDA